MPKRKETEDKNMKNAENTEAQKTRAEGLVKAAYKKLVGPHGTGKTDNLPLISVLPDDETMMQAKQDLLRAHELKDEIDRMSKELSEVKSSLAATQMAYDLPGMRWGDKAVIARWSEGRETLSREGLVKAMLARGITSETVEEIIADGSNKGKDFLVVDLRHVK